MKLPYKNGIREYMYVCTYIYIHIYVCVLVKVSESSAAMLIHLAEMIRIEISKE
jgi:hypothetical protein